jgi:hypothetical protein
MTEGGSFREHECRDRATYYDGAARRSGELGKRLSCSEPGLISRRRTRPPKCRAVPTSGRGRIRGCPKRTRRPQARVEQPDSGLGNACRARWPSRVPGCRNTVGRVIFACGRHEGVDASERSGPGQQLTGRGPVFVGEREPERFRARQHHVCESEYIGRPVKELVRDRAAARGRPRRGRRRRRRKRAPLTKPARATLELNDGKAFPRERNHDVAHAANMHPCRGGRST